MALCSINPQSSSSIHQSAATSPLSLQPTAAVETNSSSIQSHNSSSAYSPCGNKALTPVDSSKAG